MSLASIPTDLLDGLPIRFEIEKIRQKACVPNGKTKIGIRGVVKVLTASTYRDFGIAIRQRDTDMCERAFNTIIVSKDVPLGGVMAAGASDVRPYGALEDSEMYDLDGDDCADLQGPVTFDYKLKRKAKVRCDAKAQVKDIEVCLFWSDRADENCYKTKHAAKKADSGYCFNVNLLSPDPGTTTTTKETPAQGDTVKPTTAATTTSSTTTTKATTTTTSAEQSVLTSCGMRDCSTVYMAGGCQCDNYCSLVGDCCSDYAVACLDAPSTTKSTTKATTTTATTTTSKSTTTTTTITTTTTAATTTARVTTPEPQTQTIIAETTKAATTPKPTTAAPTTTTTTTTTTTPAATTTVPATTSAVPTTTSSPHLCIVRGCNSEYDPSFFCQCDEACSSAGDCCSDYAKECVNNGPIEEHMDGIDVQIPGDNKIFNTERLGDGPIITSDLFDLDDYWKSMIAGNINGPSFIKVPDWVENKLGNYYLYFAHHRGSYIRLAYADAIEGPYTIYAPGVLDLEDTYGGHHIASPDLLIDEEKQEIRMLFHGAVSDENMTQLTWAALSNDGLNFVVNEQQLGRPYFRAFRYKVQCFTRI